MDILDRDDLVRRQGYTPAHAAYLDSILAGRLAQAADEPAGPPEPDITVTPPATREVSNAEIRAWALKRKMKVPAKGRIPAAVIKAYTEANG